jgi:hypothetical protein
MMDFHIDRRCAGRSALLEVEAYVVDVENAAGADDEGLINPLLHCYHKGFFNVNVWALPAVEVGCPLASAWRS